MPDPTTKDSTIERMVTIARRSYWKGYATGLIGGLIGTYIGRILW